MIKRLNIVFILSLLVIAACGSHGIEGYVGEEISIIAENPEEGKRFDYDWTLISLPDGSLLSEIDLILDDRSKKMSFTPDYPGDYSFDVTISKYGDDISTQSFVFSILDEDAKEEIESNNSVPNDNDTEVEETWLEEEIEDVENNEYDYDDEEYDGDEYEYEDDDETVYDAAIDEDVEEVEVEVEDDDATEMVVSPAPVPTPKKVVKTKPKPAPGSSIRADYKRFTIQVVSKRNLKDAQKTAAELIMAGYDGYIQKAYFKETNETWYRVRIGSYDNRNSANAVAAAVSKNLGIKAWVDFVRFEQ